MSMCTFIPTNNLIKVYAIPNQRTPDSTSTLNKLSLVYRLRLHQARVLACSVTPSHLILIASPHARLCASSSALSSEAQRSPSEFTALAIGGTGVAAGPWRTRGGVRSGIKSGKASTTVAVSPLAVARARVRLGSLPVHATQANDSRCRVFSQKMKALSSSVARR
ncbi:hypothetical protein BDV95DRAFT_266694 [Massariosphaeria phaeospora]|uniref:Uncharacterized protein n=1 Tax=Massariosphaeria phaeospora TaxID=100035 RepID=A0A7C8HYL0_9PLEO|nr:hypothetical protein BDV95DRAFT_266694 [Massariosphaeria phaeospora]